MTTRYVGVGHNFFPRKICKSTLKRLKKNKSKSVPEILKIKRFLEKTGKQESPNALAKSMGETEQA